MARLAGQKLRASYVAGTAVLQHLLASDVSGAVAGKAPKASQIP
jgi:hypothetical protein